MDILMVVLGPKVPS